MLTRALVLGALALSVLVTSPALAAQTSCQGFGSTTPGGAGGEVYHVTTLDDVSAGPGSLRDALSAGDRTIVFDVAGTIALTDDLFVLGGNVTIDASEAPDPGITLSGGGTRHSRHARCARRHRAWCPDS